MATFQQQIEEAIHNALKERLIEIVKEETDVALAAVDKAIQKELAIISMSVLKMYRVEMGSTEIIIRVQNEKTK